MRGPGRVAWSCSRSRPKTARERTVDPPLATLTQMAAAVPRRTKIVVTLGPSCATEERVIALAQAGMNGARLNFSHGTHDQHAEYARMVRKAQDEVGRPIALIADLQGPKLRVGELEAPMLLADGDEVVVTGGEDE